MRPASEARAQARGEARLCLRYDARAHTAHAHMPQLSASRPHMVTRHARPSPSVHSHFQTQAACARERARLCPPAPP